MSNERLATLYAAAFVPISGSGTAARDVDADLRIAHAAEYAAAQLGIIARTAEKIEAHLAALAKKGPAGSSPG